MLIRKKLSIETLKSQELLMKEVVDFQTAFVELKQKKIQTNHSKSAIIFKSKRNALEFDTCQQNLSRILTAMEDNATTSILL